jgi:uncharacterized protein YgbK (DUF1537 family)
VLCGEITLTKKLKELYCANVRIVIIDATTGDDIQQIAQAVQKAKIPVFALTPACSPRSSHG